MLLLLLLLLLLFVFLKDSFSLFQLGRQRRTFVKLTLLKKNIQYLAINMFFLLFKHFYHFINLFPSLYVPSIRKKAAAIVKCKSEMYIYLSYSQKILLLCLNFITNNIYKYIYTTYLKISLLVRFISVRYVH